MCRRQGHRVSVSAGIGPSFPPWVRHATPPNRPCLAHCGYPPVFPAESETRKAPHPPCLTPHHHPPVFPAHSETCIDWGAWGLCAAR